jgi:hypothetical protein
VTYEIEPLLAVAFERGWYAHAIEQARLEADPSYSVELVNPYGPVVVEPVEGEDA